VQPITDELEVRPAAPDEAERMVDLLVLAFARDPNPANVSLYRRHGFEVICTVQVGDAPPIFPMLREPR
jgi:hypothetical protein